MTSNNWFVTRIAGVL